MLRALGGETEFPFARLIRSYNSKARMSTVRKWSSKFFVCNASKNQHGDWVNASALARRAETRRPSPSPRTSESYADKWTTRGRRSDRHRGIREGDRSLASLCDVSPA